MKDPSPRATCTRDDVVLAKVSSFAFFCAQNNIKQERMSIRNYSEDFRAVSAAFEDFSIRHCAGFSCAPWILEGSERYFHQLIRCAYESAIIFGAIKVYEVSRCDAGKKLPVSLQHLSQHLIPERVEAHR